MLHRAFPVRIDELSPTHSAIDRSRLGRTKSGRSSAVIQARILASGPVPRSCAGSSCGRSSVVPSIRLVSATRPYRGISMTTATPLACFCAVEGALASTFVNADLSHVASMPRFDEEAACGFIGPEWLRGVSGRGSTAACSLYKSDKRGISEVFSFRHCCPQCVDPSRLPRGKVIASGMRSSTVPARVSQSLSR